MACRMHHTVVTHPDGLRRATVPGLQRAVDHRARNRECHGKCGRSEERESGLEFRPTVLTIRQKARKDLIRRG